MRVDFVSGDTWVGLYFDCKLVEEGHSIAPWKVVKLLADIGCKVEIGTYWDACGDWLDNIGSFPIDLGEVVAYHNGYGEPKTIKEIWEYGH
jgi:hypothetical protein